MAFPTSDSASSLWTLSQARIYKLAGQWPSAPGVPSGLAVDAEGDQTLDISWTAGSGTNTDYVVEYTPSGGSASTVKVGSTATSYQITGLTNDTAYSVRVAGENAGLVGAYSAAVTGTPSAGDPYFANVSLLLHMDGSNGSTTFTDSSSNTFTVTRYGSAQISTAQAKFGQSGYFDGNGDYIILPWNTSTQFAANDFTVEFWFYWISGEGQLLLLNADTSLNAGIRLVARSYGFDVLVRSGNTWVVNDATNYTAPQNQWTHVALTRSGTTVRLFADGVERSSTSSVSGSLYAGTFNRVGGWTGSYVQCYIDDFRWTTGTARYTANFTPPTDAFPDA